MRGSPCRRIFLRPDGAGALRRSQENLDVAIDHGVHLERPPALSRRRCELPPDSADSSASASAFGSPTGTSRPYRPSARISREPPGQSVETVGTPQNSASIRTPGSPSQRDGQGERRGARHVCVRVCDEAGHLHVRTPARTERRAPPSFTRSGPSPRISSRAGRPASQAGEGVDQGPEVLLASEPADRDHHRGLTGPEPRDGRAALGPSVRPRA